MFDEILSSPFNLLSPVYNYFKDKGGEDLVKQADEGAYSNVANL